MIGDLGRQGFLRGKTKAEVIAYLGKPDSEFENGLGYDVVTTSRCYFWKCVAEIELESNLATGKILVSD